MQSANSSSMQQAPPQAHHQLQSTPITPITPVPKMELNQIQQNQPNTDAARLSQRALERSMGRLRQSRDSRRENPVNMPVNMARGSNRKMKIPNIPQSAQQPIQPPHFSHQKQPF